MNRADNKIIFITGKRFFGKLNIICRLTELNAPEDSDFVGKLFNCGNYILIAAFLAELKVMSFIKINIKMVGKS